MSRKTSKSVKKTQRSAVPPPRELPGRKPYIAPPGLAHERKPDLIEPKPEILPPALPPDLRSPLNRVGEPAIAEQPRHGVQGPDVLVTNVPGGVDTSAEREMGQPPTPTHPIPDHEDPPPPVNDKR